MAYTRRHWADYPDTTTPIDADALNNIEDGIEESHNIQLLAVTDTAPSECAEGDKYYDTTTNLIYTATGTDEWGETGETPIADILYIVLDEQSTYTYDGTDLVSVGGGSSAGGETLPVGSEIDYDGTTVPTGWEEVEYDSGWLDLPLASGITAQSGNVVYTPQYRKIGNVVYVEGCVKGATANNQLLATLPSGYRPVHQMRYMTGRSTTANAILQLSTNGELQFINLSDSSTVSASTYIYIQTSFLAN